MFKQLKSYVKRSPSLLALFTAIRKLTDRSINNVRDLFDSYLLKTRKAVVTPYGFRLQGSSSIHHRRMQKGAFEEEETTLLRRHLTRSEAFIDVGANIGFYSCLARSLGKSVVAVEPLNGNLNHLYANLIENKWSDVEVFPVGLCDQPGLSVLYGASSTGASLIGSWAGASKRIRRVIPVSTLDILLGERFAGKKLFIKIDVEGVEYQVLMGAIKTMQLNPRPTWMIEICLNEFYPGGFNPNYQATFNLFWQQGYEIRTADNEYKLIKAEDVERWVNAGRCDSGVINYLFIPV